MSDNLRFSNLRSRMPHRCSTQFIFKLFKFLHFIVLYNTFSRNVRGVATFLGYCLFAWTIYCPRNNCGKHIFFDGEKRFGNLNILTVNVLQFIKALHKKNKNNLVFYEKGLKAGIQTGETSS